MASHDDCHWLTYCPMTSVLALRELLWPLFSWDFEQANLSVGEQASVRNWVII